MATFYKDIPAQEVLDIILDDIINNVKTTPDKKLLEIEKIFNKNYCVYCGNIYYNCLCSHDN
jgi:hypothetical protein